MLDVARKPISMETLQSIVKEMAYYKMNDFQVHLNDNLIFYENYGTAEEALESAYTGFRLESDIKEGGNNGLNQAGLRIDRVIPDRICAAQHLLRTSRDRRSADDIEVTNENVSSYSSSDRSSCSPARAK